MSVDEDLREYDDRAEGALRHLQARAYRQAEAKGFWDDEPTTPGSDLEHYQGNKLMLIVTEVAEAHEQLRKGHPVDETYYPTARMLDGEPVGSGPWKPEGLPSELADTVIRAFDFAGKYKIDLAAMIFEKLRYNATRPFKHGRRF